MSGTGSIGKSPAYAAATGARKRPPSPAKRASAARKASDLSRETYEAKRRGDLDGAQKSMRKLAAAQKDLKKMKNGR